MDFLDDDPVAATSNREGSLRQRRGRGGQRSPRQQIMIRRGIALAGGLLILILLVLGVRGCLDARKERSLRDYARDVSQIGTETEQTSEAFFARLNDPGGLSTQEFLDEVNTDRGAVDGYLSRVENLNTPGDMDAAQNALELVYQFRSNALTEIANLLPTATGTAGRQEAIEKIAEETRTLLASDQIYEKVVQPEVDRVLADNDITDSDLTENQFVADGIKWLSADQIEAALGQVSGASTDQAATPGPHGTALIATTLSGTPLEEGAPVTFDGTGAPEIEAQVQNQGAAEENVTVTVTVDGGDPVSAELSGLAPDATESVTVPLTPAPTGEVTLDVEAEPVPGEETTDNNVASYTVDFG